MSENKQDGLYILRAETKNFKNIELNTIDIAGRSMIIAGKNGTGKSSLIQSLLSPINSNYVPLEPIKKGEESGHTEITIGGYANGEHVKYNVGYYFSQEHKRGRLTLSDKTGAKIKGGEKGILDSIIGNISFDIMDFIAMGQTKTGKPSKDGVREQIEILKGLMPDEDLKKLADLDFEKTKKYDERTEINRSIKFKESSIDKSSFTIEDIEKYSEEKSAASIAESITKARAYNESFDAARTFVDSYEATEKVKLGRIEEIKAELAKAETELTELKDKKTKADKFFAKDPKRKDIEALNKSLNNISEHNTKHNEIKALEVLKEEVVKEKEEAEVLSTRLKEIDSEKKIVFKTSKMPIKGLAFNDESVTFRDLPLSEGNIPKSQLIAIGLKVGMALNPNLRLLVIRDGSLLDEDTMKYILKTCEKNNYQLLIEVVDSNKDEVKIDFIEK